MIERLILRKPRLFFDVAAAPVHVTFDDGQALRRNLAWHDYVEARRTHSDPDRIELEIGSWLVEIHGHNLDPLFVAIEEQTLLRLCARPDLDQRPEYSGDSFATEIEFLRLIPGPPGRRGGQLDLGISR